MIHQQKHGVHWFKSVMQKHVCALANSMIHHQDHMRLYPAATELCMTQGIIVCLYMYRTAKVSVANHVKHSHTVKGRQHDQAFDEVLEFVLAGGNVSQTCPAHPVWQICVSSVNVMCGSFLKLSIHSMHNIANALLLT